MMRIFLVACVLAIEAQAVAAKPAVIRSVWSVCPERLSSESLVKCLGRFGEVVIERTLDHAKVIRIENATDTPPPGFYLYQERGPSPRLADMFQLGRGGTAEILAVSKVTVAGQRGYRFEIGSVGPSEVVLDDTTVLAAKFQRQTIVYCIGHRFYCPSVVRSCDVFVGGKAYYTFRGTVAMDRRGRVTVTGDSSRAGGVCSPSESAQIVDKGPPP